MFPINLGKNNGTLKIIMYYKYTYSTESKHYQQPIENDKLGIGHAGSLYCYAHSN